MELSQREKLLAFIALAVLGPLLLVRFVFIPIQNYQVELSNKIVNMEKKLIQINTLGQELKHLKKETRSTSGSLSKIIDRILRQSKLKSKSVTIVGNQPKGGQRLVLKLEEINLTELCTIIYKIENNKPGILIENIDTNPSYKNKKLIHVSMALTSE